MHDWDASSITTLVLGLTATAGLFALLAWGFSRG